jgi:two-component system, cell cycle response regulator
MQNNAYNVLVVDDDPVASRLLSTILMQAGYAVELACDGLQALASIERLCPDFLITDWEMPRMNGLELCRKIRERAQAKYIFTLFITGRSGSDNLIEGFESGADDFLTKPVQREVLLARLRAGERVLELERQLNTLASTDPMTDLLTKRAFFPQLDKEWRRAQRYQLPLSCVVLDADFFKRINDTFGHPAGDQVLVAIAEILREDTRASDILCRWGGEEFVALLPETDEESATLWAERVRSQVADRSFTFGSRTVGITCSFGVAERTPDISGGEELLALADQALMAAKQSGRDRVVSFSAMDRNNVVSESLLDREFSRQIDETRAADVMTTFIASLSESDSVQQAALHFLRSRLSSAPVVNSAGELSGIVTEKDLLVLMRSPRNWLRPLSEIMKRNVICYELETPIINIYEFLCRVAIRQVIIVERGRPLGMINQMNLVCWFNNWFETQILPDRWPFSLAYDHERTHASIVTAVEQLSGETHRFLESVQNEHQELVPLLIASTSRIQEKLNDLLALSRHANEFSADLNDDSSESSPDMKFAADAGTNSLPVVVD